MITFLDFIIHILRCRVVTREDYRRSGILYSFSKYSENPGKYSRWVGKYSRKIRRVFS